LKLLITQTLPQSVMDAASSQFDTTTRDGLPPLSEEEARDALAQYDLILPSLGDGFTAAAFDGATRCKLLANFGVGYNHIDVAAARAAGVDVTNTPGTVTDATADIAMTLLLMSARRASEGEALLRSGRWTGWTPTQLLGNHVTGKTLGILGMGRIGKAIAKRAHYGFDMDIVFHNRSRVADAGLPARQLANVEEVLAAADFTVVAVPATPETWHLINTETLAHMPAHAHLINIARGDIVDETALITALQTGQIAGAGLDVYEFEPLVAEALREIPNVTLLPHMGTAALEVREAMGNMALGNLTAFAAGKPLINPV
jgi:lactate dehydrogenase-like 2-hydroxyacid dehydrogenase